jgi:ribonuclease P protein component
MLPKNNRVKKEVFEELLKKGAVLHSPLFLFRFIKSDKGEPKIAFVVSKKVASSAVERNKMRRRGYSAIRKIRETNAFVPLIGVFFFKKGADKATLKEMQAEMEILLKKAGIV